MLRRILVPVDFSSASAHAVAVARDYCPEKATIRMLHVVSASKLANETSSPTVNPLHAKEIRSKAEEEAVELLQRWAYDDEEVAVEVGNPADKISEHADRWDADLIAVGTSRRSGLSQFLHGSATEWLVRHANQPVLAVHDLVMDSERSRLLPPMD